MLCNFCDELSVSHLIELAEIEFSAHEFPQEAYYQHHASYADLVSSANKGCELCELIYQGFIETVVDGGDWDEYTLDGAVRVVESEGLSTDLKICINTSYLNLAKALEHVKLFDTILVQAGIRRSELDYQEESKPLDYLTLDLSVPRGKSRFVRNFEVGRYHTDPDLGSSQNYEIAKGWLENCCALHGEETQPTQTSKLPTRVIDVGDLNGSQNPKIFLSEATEDKYAALSHCWGGVISPLLTTQNLESFQKSIPYCDLPANFRDAISITRKLGIRYLWIDSLCIIQNSRLDWEKESKKMGSIYRDALLTISASTSRGSTDGILKFNSLSNENKNNVALQIYKNSNLSDSVCISRRPKKKPENLSDLFGQCPLSQRGWTLQEGLLSPRILYYGERQIYWKCLHGFQSADGVPSEEDGPIMPDSYSTFPRITSIIHRNIFPHSHPRVPQSDMILEDYYWLVREYSSRQLTFKSDKLPAFSGIAELLHPIIGGEYLAGIWSRDIAQGLSWFEEMGACKHVELYRAPSWSWAVTDDRVVFYLINNQPIFSDVFDVRMVSCNVNLKTQNAYGQIESGQLILKGWTKDLVRSSQEINTPYEEFAATIHYDEPEGEVGNGSATHLFNVNSDNGDYFLSPRDGNGPKQLIKEIEIDQKMFSKHNYTIILIRTLLDEGQFIRGMGLALLKINDKIWYERVGFIEFYPMHLTKFESWIAGWTQQTITLI